MNLLLQCASWIASLPRLPGLPGFLPPCLGLPPKYPRLLPCLLLCVNPPPSPLPLIRERRRAQQGEGEQEEEEEMDRLVEQVAALRLENEQLRFAADLMEKTLEVGSGLAGARVGRCGCA